MAKLTTLQDLLEKRGINPKEFITYMEDLGIPMNLEDVVELSEIQDYINEFADRHGEIMEVLTQDES